MWPAQRLTQWFHTSFHSDSAFKTGSDSRHHGRLACIYISISEVAAKQSCATSLQRNMPRIIISLTHLFVSLGISEGRKGIFYCDRDSSLNEGLPSNNLGYPAAFCSSARVREGGGILRWSDASFRKHRRPAYSLIIPLYHMLQR